MGPRHAWTRGRGGCPAGARVILHAATPAGPISGPLILGRAPVNQLLVVPRWIHLRPDECDPCEAISAITKMKDFVLSPCRERQWTMTKVRRQVVLGMPGAFQHHQPEGLS